MWLYVSLVLTDVHVRSFVDVNTPFDVAALVRLFRVVSPAAAVVPASPGSAVCSLTYRFASCRAVGLALLNSASMMVVSPKLLIDTPSSFRRR
jgi:hypothetical protein